MLAEAGVSHPLSEQSMESGLPFQRLKLCEKLFLRRDRLLAGMIQVSLLVLKGARFNQSQVQNVE